MTNAQRYLLNAARDAKAYMDRQAAGLPPKGLFEDLGIGRALAGAIAAVEREEGIDDASMHAAGARTAGSR